MANKGRIGEFIQRWRIVIPNQRLFSEFQTRVTKVVRAFLHEVFKADFNLTLSALEVKFAEFNGSEYVPWTQDSPGKNISGFISGARSFPDLLLVLERVFWAIEKTQPTSGISSQWQKAIQSFIDQLNTAIDRSPGINLRRIEISQGAIELYPEGIKVLDEIVDGNVLWLKPYPDVGKEYQNALRIATTKDVKLHRQALDSLRFALEKLLKIVLENNSSLEKQKDHLLKWMKEKGVHTQIRQNYSTVLTQFSLYQNTAVKHDNELVPEEVRSYSPSELEYMIYLTTTLMHFILQLYRTGAS